jgi:hypothetical protein
MQAQPVTTDPRPEAESAIPEPAMSLEPLFNEPPPIPWHALAALAALVLGATC